jgi:hypothetical protein
MVLPSVNVTLKQPAPRLQFPYQGRHASAVEFVRRSRQELVSLLNKERVDDFYIEGNALSINPFVESRLSVRTVARFVPHQDVDLSP